MKKDYKNFKYSSHWREDDSLIIFLEYNQNLVIDVNVANEIVKSRLEYTDNNPHYMLIDFTNVKSVTKEARDYMNDVKGGLKGIKGGAFLSNNVVGNLFINLYLNINKPSVPAKFFRDKNEALEWLRKIIKENERSK